MRSFRISPPRLYPQTVGICLMQRTHIAKFGLSIHSVRWEGPFVNVFWLITNRLSCPSNQLSNSCCMLMCREKRSEGRRVGKEWSGGGAGGECGEKGWRQVGG